MKMMLNRKFTRVLIVASTTIILIVINLVLTSCVDKANPVVAAETSDKPYTPVPADSAKEQISPLTLSWKALNATKYDVIFDTVSPPVAYLVKDTSASTLTVKGLTLGTKYYWKVIAKKSDGTMVTGPIWNFSTTEAQPHNPSPADSSVVQALSQQISWASSGAGNFDVLLDTVTPPRTYYCRDTASTTLILNNLMANTKYYWKVIAKKNIATQFPGPVWSFTTTGIQPHNPTPANLEVDQQLSLSLSWATDGTNTYDILFDNVYPPAAYYAKGLSANSLSIGNLSYSTTYYWQVIAKKTGGAQTPGAIWSFTTRGRFTGSSGYQLIPYYFNTALPCYMNVMFQVVDMQGAGIVDLTTADFSVLEDNAQVSPTESGVNIKKKDATPYTFKTVLMLDNSTSLTANLRQVKDAAISLINNMTSGQQIALYDFSENTNLIQDFTSDKSVLINAVNSIPNGYATTDLYGAAATGLTRWDDSYATTNIEQGALIIVTDGSDTQGKHTLADVLNAKGSKRVYTIGLGSEIDPQALRQIGSSGFFQVSDISQLTEQFNKIQTEVSNYSNSFYWLNYMSPKRGDFNHTLTLSIKNNPNVGSSATIINGFNSKDFYSVSSRKRR